MVKNSAPSSESGNAVIYVLIVIVLLAALGFVISRQSGSSETSVLSARQVEIDATQILQTSMQVKQAIDSMMYSVPAPTTPGQTVIDRLDFTLPSEAGFDAAPTMAKVFHPDGGGVSLPALPQDAAVATSDPAPGWYLGRFNNVEWTATSGTDVMLVAYNIAKSVCAKIDEKITGSATIPVATVPLRTVLVSATRHSGSNTDLTASNCPGCKGFPALCVQDSSGTGWSYYSLMETR